MFGFVMGLGTDDFLESSQLEDTPMEQAPFADEDANHHHHGAAAAAAEDDAVMIEEGIIIVFKKLTM
jgi:hypothetical protein